MLWVCACRSVCKEWLGSPLMLLLLSPVPAPIIREIDTCAQTIVLYVIFFGTSFLQNGKTKNLVSVDARGREMDVETRLERVEKSPSKQTFSPNQIFMILLGGWLNLYFFLSFGSQKKIQSFHSRTKKQTTREGNQIIIHQNSSSSNSFFFRSDLPSRMHRARTPATNQQICDNHNQSAPSP